MEFEPIAKRLCSSATEIEGNGPFRLFEDHVFELWFHCEDDNQYNVAFVLERKGKIVPVRGVAAFVRLLNDTYQAHQSSNTIPLAANLIAVGILMLVGIIAIWGNTLGTGSWLQAAAAIVVVVLGAGVSLRFLGYRVKIKEIDLSRFISWGS